MVQRSLLCGQLMVPPSRGVFSNREIANAAKAADQPASLHCTELEELRILLRRAVPMSLRSPFLVTETSTSLFVVYNHQLFVRVGIVGTD